MSIEDRAAKLAVIDFETLSTAQNAQVLSLAITWFYAYRVDSIYTLRKQTKSWNFATAPQYDRHVDASTEDWWQEQSKFAWDAHRTEPLLHPSIVLTQLSEYCQTNDITYLVGNGIGFDNVLLKNLCEEFDKGYPVAYWGDLDLRTMRWLSDHEKLDFPQDLTPHIAADDCIYEALMFQKIFQELKTPHD